MNNNEKTAGLNPVMKAVTVMSITMTWLFLVILALRVFDVKLPAGLSNSMSVEPNISLITDGDFAAGQDLAVTVITSCQAPAIIALSVEPQAEVNTYVEIPLENHTEIHAPITFARCFVGDNNLTEFIIPATLFVNTAGAQNVTSWGIHAYLVSDMLAQPYLNSNTEVEYSDFISPSELSFSQTWFYSPDVVSNNYALPGQEVYAIPSTYGVRVYYQNQNLIASTTISVGE